MRPGLVKQISDGRTVEELAELIVGYRAEITRLGRAYRQEWLRAEGYKQRALLMETKVQQMRERRDAERKREAC